jgi:hypothetical protein
MKRCVPFALIVTSLVTAGNCNTQETVFLTDGKLKMTFPDGKTVVGTVKKGQVVWEEASPHQPENLTDEPFEVREARRIWRPLPLPE